MCYSVNWLFFITCAKEPIYKKRSENHDFYVAKVFLIFIFFCDDAMDNMCDRFYRSYDFRNQVYKPVEKAEIFFDESD